MVPDEVKGYHQLFSLHSKEPSLVERKSAWLRWHRSRVQRTGLGNIVGVGLESRRLKGEMDRLDFFFSHQV